MTPAAPPRNPTARCRGMATLELAITLPLIVTMLLGVWDFGRLVAARQTLSNAAREAGRQASTAQKDENAVKATISNYLVRSGISTTGLTVDLTNLTQTGRTNPQGAVQLDRYKVDVTLPSNNVRLILLSSLLGTSTLRASTTWMSMVDIPLAVPSSIPVN